MSKFERPNILHICTDQQRADTIGALGNRTIQTPHLDRLVREGTSFTSAFTPSAECVPARCCMITGMYADRTGCGSNEQDMVPEDHPTLMSYLSNGGYRTHGIGKCHFTPDPWAMRGFQTRDFSEELPDKLDEDDYYRSLQKSPYSHVMEPHGIRGEMYYTPQPSQVPAEHHPSQWVGDRCLDFIGEQNGNDQPWYCYTSFIHPHPPFSPPNPWHKLYRAPDMPLPYLPENREELLCFINHFQNRYKYRDRGLDLNLIRCIRAYYYACISFIDYQIGRILEALEATGQLDQTLIVFHSDHGELLGDFGCFGKRSFHDASLKIPLLMRYPEGLPAGGRCESPASLVDLLPTFLAAGNIQCPDTIDGTDLIGLAKGSTHRDGVFFHYAGGENALWGKVDSKYKYVWSAPDQKPYLFKRSDSPETTNLAGQEAGICQSRDEDIRKRASGFSFGRKALDTEGKWKKTAPGKMPNDPDEGLIYQDPNTKPAPKLPDEYRFTYPGKL